MIESGVDEFPAVTPRIIHEAMKIVKGEKTLLMFHAEMQPQEHRVDFQFLDEEDLPREEELEEANAVAIEDELMNTDFDLGMSASFINRAPQPVVKLLRNDPGTHKEEHELCKLPHNHAGSIDESVLSNEQAKNWHIPQSWLVPTQHTVKMQ